MNLSKTAKIHVCGVTCHRGDANCNGYCTDSRVPHAKLIEAGIVVNATGPRLTPSHIDAAVLNEAFHVFPGSTVTVCMLTLRNGAKVLGHNYGSIDTTQQDWPTGRREARAMAVEKVWELEGYLLRETLSSPAKAAPEADAVAQLCGNCLGTGVEHGVYESRPCGFCCDSAATLSAPDQKR